MNTTFTLKDVEISIGEEQTIKIGELSTSVTDYNVLEGLQVSQALPAILRDIKDVVFEAVDEYTKRVEDYCSSPESKSFSPSVSEESTYRHPVPEY